MNEKNKAIVSPYLTYKVNEDIPIHDGKFCIWINYKKYKCRGRIYYKMNNPISINFEAQLNSVGQIKEIKLNEEDSIYLEVHGYKKILVTINTINYSTISGYVVNSYIKSKDTLVDYLDFNIINLNKMPGTLIKNEDILFAGRLVFEINEYEVIIDKRYDYAKEMYDELKSKSGNLITHIGRIRKKDNSKCETLKSRFIIENIMYTLMFLCGRHVGVCVIDGFNDSKNVFKMWEEAIITPFEFVPTWSDTISNYNNIEKYLGLMSKKLEDRYYGVVIKQAIDWYIESSRNTTIENNIVSIQIALEMLSYALLVEQNGKISEEKFEHNTASSNIRLLLEICSIHCGKDELNLFNEYIQKKFDDGCDILTYCRNKIVHPRRNLSGTNFSTEDMWHILQIGIRYVELIILYIIGYKGEYSNRLEYRSYGEVSLVPWNK